MPFSTPANGTLPFDTTLAPFLHAAGLPFADVLSAEDIDRAFADEHATFGQTPHSFWTPALTLWTFLSQVLNGIKSCRAAVVRAFVALALTRRKAVRLDFLDRGAASPVAYGHGATDPVLCCGLCRPRPQPSRRTCHNL
jgi:hypothetical protein